MIEKIIEAVLLVLVAAIVVMLVLLLLQPSCADRGGRLVYDGTKQTPVLVGKVLILQPRASYRCEGARSGS